MSHKAIRAAIGSACMIATVALSVPATADAAPAKPAGHRHEAPTQIGDVAPRTMAGQGLQFDLGETPDIPALESAQMCDPGGPSTYAPTAGRTWSYYDPAHDTSGLSADLAITAWTDASRAFTEVRSDTGRCVLMDGLSVHRWPGQNPNTHLIVTGTTNGLGVADAVIRTGPYLISVNIIDWSNAGDELAVAKAEALRLAKRL